ADQGHRGVNLRQNLIQRLAAVCDRDGAVAVVVDHHGRVDAQAVIDRRANVTNVHRTVLDVGGVGVGGAVHTAAAHAGAGQNDRVAERPVVAAAVGVEL